MKRVAIAIILATLCLLSACSAPATVKSRALAPQRPTIDLSRDQMRERALDLVDLGLLSRRDVPDRSRVPEMFSSAQSSGNQVYPFALFITTPPTSAHPGTYFVPIDGGNLIHRFVIQLEYLQVGSRTEPYYVMYAEHGPGVYSVVSGDSNVTALEALPPE